jgi:hypothetical protein
MLDINAKQKYIQAHIQKYTVAKKSANTLNEQLNLKIQNVQISDDYSHLLQPPTTSITLLGNLVALIVFWTVFLTMLSKLKITLASEEKSFSIDTVNKSPCCECKYLLQNKYLQCAVNPSVVFTEDAINCPDYCFKGERG